MYSPKRRASATVGARVVGPAVEGAGARVEQARQRAATIATRVGAGENPIPAPMGPMLPRGPPVAEPAARYLCSPPMMAQGAYLDEDVPCLRVPPLYRVGKRGVGAERAAQVPGLGVVAAVTGALHVFAEEESECYGRRKGRRAGGGGRGRSCRAGTAAGCDHRHPRRGG